MSPSIHNYGTVDENSHTTHALSDEEDHPLLPKCSKTPLSQRLRKHLTQDVNTYHGDFILLLCYVITGLLDSSAIFIWTAFVSMQTGNTVYFGLGLVDPKSGTRWIKSLISICFFCLGSLSFSRFHRYFSPRKRWVLVTSYVVQMLLIAAAAVMVMLDRTEGNTLSWHVGVPLALLAFQSSGQAVTSRALKFNSLTSVVLTSIYCDLFSDPDLFSGPTKNAERNRRASAPVCLLFGAILGGFWSHSDVGLVGALWTAVALKFCIVVAWLLWKPAAEDSETHSE